MPSFFRFLCLIIFIVIKLSCFAQQSTQVNPTQNSHELFDAHLKKSLLSWYSKRPQEKVFVHTNQSYYNNGETIWYKVYALAYGKLSAISKVIYVRLTDTEGNLITQNMRPLIDGKANGNIDLNISLKTGWYKLNAFTSWMMNFEQQASYEQLIYVRNSGDSTSANEEKGIPKRNYHINFYPEGGDLIDGRASRIAFHASDQFDLPAKVEGEIKDDANQTIVKLVSTSSGMGEFAVMGSVNHSYQAAVRFPDGSEQVVKLPEAKASGVSLQVSQTPTVVHLKVGFTGSNERFQKCILSAIQNSGQIVTYPIQLSPGRINEFDLQKSGFLTGILRLTIFDSEGMPQAERILFINRHDLQVKSFETGKLSTLPREPNAFTAELKGSEGRPVNGNFSIAVTEEGTFTDGGDQNIFSALLLSPELKGKIYHPGYYFENESDTLAQNLDLVMLTNGWRHFSWQKILKDEPTPTHYPAEQGIYFAGKLMQNGNAFDRRKKNNIKLLLTGQDSSRFLGSVTPDDSGKFIIKDFNHSGNSDVYLQLVDEKGHKVKSTITVVQSLNDSLSKVKGIPFKANFDPEVLKYNIFNVKRHGQHLISSDVIALKTVNIKDKKITKTEKLIAQHVSPKYKSDREFTLDLVNNPTLNMSLIDYMKGKFPGLQITGDSGNPIFVYRGGNTLQARTSSNSLPYFYLNEAQVQYPSISSLSLTEVAMIRFMPPPVWFAPLNGGDVGAIMIYTKNQSDGTGKVASITDTFEHYIFNGYNITREFSAPDYSQNTSEQVHDNRTTLYWNHDLNTDKSGDLKFKFYNSDVTKRFKVVIQGIDQDGSLLYFQKILPQTSN